MIFKFITAPPIKSILKLWMIIIIISSNDNIIITSLKIEAKVEVAVTTSTKTRVVASDGKLILGDI